MLSNFSTCAPRCSRGGNASLAFLGFSGLIAKFNLAGRAARVTAECHFTGRALHHGSHAALDDIAVDRHWNGPMPRDTASTAGHNVNAPARPRQNRAE